MQDYQNALRHAETEVLLHHSEGDERVTKEKGPARKSFYEQPVHSAAWTVSKNWKLVRRGSNIPSLPLL